MKRFLKKPVTNAVCISLFTAFYSLTFILTAGNVEFNNGLYFNQITQRDGSFWYAWCDFLADGYHAYTAYVLMALTAGIVILLLTSRKPYDEYQVDKLITCLVTALFLTLVAIALFFLVLLSESNGAVEKFMLFISIHWTTVVLADLVYVLACRRK